MATWASLHIKTSNLREVKDFIKQYFHFETEVSGSFPENYQESYLLNSSEPNLVVIGQTQEDWLTIRHNTLNLLDDWSEILSKEFNIITIGIVAQNTSDCYGFLMYDKGEKIRERTSGEEINKNWGTPLAFEEELAGTIFDFYAIEDLCQSFGLNIQTDYSRIEWVNLRIDNNKMTLRDFTQKYLGNKRPWWKFW